MAAHSLLGKHNESYSHFAHFREGLCELWMCIPEDIWICQMETRIWSPRHWEILSLTSLGKMQMKCCRLRLHCTLCFFVLTVLLLLPKFIWRCFLLKIFLWFCQRSCFYKKNNNVFRPFPSTSRTESISFVKANLNPKNSRTFFQCSKDIHIKYKWNTVFVLQKWVSFWNIFCYKTLKYFQKCFANAFCSNLCFDTIWFKKRQIISNYQLKIINVATWYGHLW